MKKHPTIPPILISVLTVSFTVFLIAILFGTKMDRYIGMKEKSLKAQIVSQCTQLSLMSWKNIKDNTDGHEINKTLYDGCLKDSGY